MNLLQSIVAKSNAGNVNENTIVHRVLEYIEANHKDMICTVAELESYIRRANFQNYILLGGTKYVGKFKDDETFNAFLVKNLNEFTGATKGTAKLKKEALLLVWGKRAKPYKNSHFLNEKPTSQFSLNFDDRFAYRCALSPDLKTVSFTLKIKKAK